MRIRMSIAVLTKAVKSLIVIQRRAALIHDRKIARSARSALKRLTTEWEVILD